MFNETALTRWPKATKQPCRDPLHSALSITSPPICITYSVHTNEILASSFLSGWSLVGIRYKGSLASTLLLSRNGISPTEMPPTDPVEPNAHQARRTRQNPVSCRLCRLKKLKCNRQYPCSNCSARGVGCEYFARIPGSSSTDVADQRQALPAAAESAGFQTRLERLEEAVFNKQQDGKPSVSTATEPSNRGTLATTIMPGFAFNEEHETTSRRLEDIGTLGNPAVSLYKDDKTANVY